MRHFHHAELQFNRTLHLQGEEAYYAACKPLAVKQAFSDACNTWKPETEIVDGLDDPLRAPVSSLAARKRAEAL
jgi:hypothetical protein